MRNEIIPKHIRLDTTTLVHLLMTKKQGKKSDYLFKGNLKRFEDKIIKTTSDLSLFLLDKARVSVVTGEAFGTDTHIRISYAASEEILREAKNARKKKMNRKCTDFSK